TALVTAPDRGAVTRTLTLGRVRTGERLVSQPSSRNCPSRQRPLAAQASRGSSAGAFRTTGPCGTSVTGRVIPPQFHQPSRGSGPLRLSTSTTSSFGWPGRRGPAGSVNGTYG